MYFLARSVAIVQRHKEYVLGLYNLLCIFCSICFFFFFLFYFADAFKCPYNMPSLWMCVYVLFLCNWNVNKSTNIQKFSDQKCQTKLYTVEQKKKKNTEPKYRKEVCSKLMLLGCVQEFEKWIKENMTIAGRMNTIYFPTRFQKQIKS